jgi:prepilin-type processing-associated H-X9-DG protein
MEIKTADLRQRAGGGFTRTDLNVVLGVILLLGVLVWAVMAGSKATRQIYGCASHQKTLGQAFIQYSHDHEEALPPAVIADQPLTTSWDREIAPYLEPHAPKPGNSAEQKAMEAKVAYLFKCPSDREPRGGAQPRSYSMPMYDINKDGWPPDENSSGGLGLYLDAKTMKKAWETNPLKQSEALPAIKTSVVPSPSDTALLVERISILNALWQPKFACIISTREQFDAKTFTAKEFHGGKMNYLMLDGHVELLWPAQSGGHLAEGDQSLWTIRPGD